MEEKIQLSLYRDYSELALKLEENLLACGYEVKTILSGSPRPIVSGKVMFISGYCDINRIYLSRFEKEI